ncbi:hypothetical protein C8A00DRAFT_39768 [Chaetomidium leptoderma]|uniref:Uncharacterized protein n=1 Tax=Chaetomidium leptoderma TaxID=669021 RepID=A0AAN6VUY9_9PEZI|nr:hypothetical protein C8A00DRAFT_39768 [Chaetomidium leptoderma]
MDDDFSLYLLSGNGAGNDDLDSLFGGDDDTELTSLFTEVGAVAPPWQEPNCEPASPSSQARPHQATNPAAQLCLPEVPAPAQFDHEQAHWPLQLSLPAVPDPLAALLSLQDGHTSGDLVVSTQDSTHNTPGTACTVASPGEISDDAALEAELESLWESITSQEQPVNAHSESPESDAVSDDNIILPTQIPGFRYGRSNTNSWIRLPRRIDRDQKEAEELMYYITLKDLYGHLELDIGEGKRLSGEMKKLLKEPPLVQFVEQPATRSSQTKKNLIRIGLYMLISKQWGSTWFGDGCTTAKPRTLLWPRDSSILLAGFVMLLYRMYNNQRQMHQTFLRAQARSLQNNSTTNSAESPSPSSRSPSAMPADRLPESPPPTPECQAFFEAVARDASAAKKRKHAEAVLGITTTTTTAAAGGQPVHEVEVPANARLKYHVYIKDKTDGGDLAPPTTYRHTDYMIARGAFASLKSSFEAAGQVPIVEIQTPFGRKSITSEEEWENAVLAIYNVRRAGGVVEVDVFV